MKPFSLEEALAGEPVKLRDGSKAWVKYVMPDDYKGEFPLRGICCSVTSDTNYIDAIWTKCGNRFYSGREGDLDIISMWEEPRPRVQLDLPAPLENVEKGQEVYYLELGNQFSQVSKFNFNEDNPCAFQLYKNGGLFATKEDAQEWLDAMKGARR